MIGMHTDYAQPAARGAQNLPGAEGAAFARKLNTWVAEEVVADRPERFRGNDRVQERRKGAS